MKRQIPAKQTMVRFQDRIDIDAASLTSKDIIFPAAKRDENSEASLVCLGVATENLKRLFSLTFRYARKIKELNEELAAAEDGEEHHRIGREMDYLSVLSTILEEVILGEIFLANSDLDLNEVNLRSYSLFSDWQIYAPRFERDLKEDNRDEDGIPLAIDGRSTRH
jgi:hypothetical protein